MDIGAIFILLALFILVALFLAQPYMERRASRVSETELELSALLAARDNAIDTLKELEFDHELGKIPEEDYPEQRETLLKRGADTLRKLDAYHAENDAQTSPEARLNEEVASAMDVFAEDELESLIAARRSQRKGRSSGFCPNCGKPILSNDKFCTNCGEKIQ